MVNTTNGINRYIPLKETYPDKKNSNDLLDGQMDWCSLKHSPLNEIIITFKTKSSPKPITCIVGYSTESIHWIKSVVKKPPKLFQMSQLHCHVSPVHQQWRNCDIVLGGGLIYKKIAMEMALFWIFFINLMRLLNNLLTSGGNPTPMRYGIVLLEQGLGTCVCSIILQTRVVKLHYLLSLHRFTGL